MKTTCQQLVTCLAMSLLLAITGGAVADDSKLEQIIKRLESKVQAKSEGSTNTSYGKDALRAVTSRGANNNAIGAQALRYNTKGYSNTAIGRYALYQNRSGGYNTASGVVSLFSNTTGYRNTAMGMYGLAYNKTGSDNTALGYSAGYQNNKGSGNVFIGHKAGYYEKGSQKLFIDNSNTTKPLFYGDFSKNTLKVNGKMYATRFFRVSDARLKVDIRPLNNALDTVLRLKGKQYRLIDESVDQTDIGLIAQDVEKILPEVVSQTEDGYKAITYQSLTAVLIEAMKEQQQQITALEKENQQLKTIMAEQMDALLARVAMLEGESLASN